MQTLTHGNNLQDAQGGFIFLRNLLVMLLVIICFAGVVSSMAAVSRQSSRYLENVQDEIEKRNELVIKRINK